MKPKFVQLVPLPGIAFYRENTSGTSGITPILYALDETGGVWELNGQLNMFECIYRPTPAEGSKGEE